LLEIRHEAAPFEHLGEDVRHVLARDVGAAELGDGVVAVLVEHFRVQLLGTLDADRRGADRRPLEGAGELVEEQAPQRFRRARVAREQRPFHGLGQVREAEDVTVGVGEEWSQRGALRWRERVRRRDHERGLYMSHFSHRLEVRFRDCDALGHTNNAVYLTYLEQARFAHWRSLWGFGSPQTAPDLPGVILARVEADYKRPSRNGDVLEVRLTVGEIGRSSFRYEYEIVDEQGRTVLTARTVQVM